MPPARVGIHLNPAFSNSSGLQSHEYDGVALTYAAGRLEAAAAPPPHRGDARPWSSSTRSTTAATRGRGATASARPSSRPTRRLSLTGTPFRSDTNPIPFVRYEMGEDGILRSASDYTYGYAAALRDGVVRPVLFLAYGGAMRWRTKAGDEVAARLGEPLTKDQTAQAWRTALDPKGEWVPSVLAAADKRLSEVRRHVPDAGGLVIASNQTSARAYARHPARASPARSPTVVLSDDAGASAGIEAFAADTSRWMVAVRMVSEGVDVPRLCVGVYATSTSTPLFFAQAVGRFVRARRRGETASVFLPVGAGHPQPRRDDGGGARPRPRPADDRRGRGLAVGGGGGPARGGEPHRAGPSGLEETAFEALESDAHFDHVLFDAQQFGLHAAVGSRGGAGLPRPARPARARPGRHPAARAAGEADAGPRVRAVARRRHPDRRRSRRTAPWPRSARSSTSSSRPTRRRPAPRTRASTSTCAGRAAGPSWPPPRASRCSSAIERIRRWFVGRR